MLWSFSCLLCSVIVELKYRVQGKTFHAHGLDLGPGAHGQDVLSVFCAYSQPVPDKEGTGNASMFVPNEGQQQVTVSSQDEY